MLLHTYALGNQKIGDSLYYNICFDAVVWTHIGNISEVCLYNQVLVRAISKRQEASLQQNWLNRTAEEIRTFPILITQRYFFERLDR